MQRKKT